MRQTNPPDDEEPQAQRMPLWEGPSFEDLMLLVFSGPMRFDDAKQDDEIEEANNEEEDKNDDQE